jgi:hypothetical protein
MAAALSLVADQRAEAPMAPRPRKRVHVPEAGRCRTLSLNLIHPHAEVFILRCPSSEVVVCERLQMQRRPNVFDHACAALVSSLASGAAVTAATAQRSRDNKGLYILNDDLHQASRAHGEELLDKRCGAH